MNPDIKTKVDSLKSYLEKEPSAATEMALHFYLVYLELFEETQTLISINESLLQQLKENKTVSLPSFLQCYKY